MSSSTYDHLARTTAPTTGSAAPLMAAATKKVQSGASAAARTSSVMTPRHVERDLRADHPALAVSVDQHRDRRCRHRPDQNPGGVYRTRNEVRVGDVDHHQQQRQAAHRQRQAGEEASQRERPGPRSAQQAARRGWPRSHANRATRTRRVPGCTCGTRRSGQRAYDALLLVSFGGPEGPDDVVPFLQNVTRGRDIPEERLREAGQHYFHFGGVSPINAQNREFLDALRDALRCDRARPAGLLGQPQLDAVPR